MAEWLIEEGIGEHRAIRTEGADIAASRIWWPGEIAAGHVHEAVIAHRQSGSARATAHIADGRTVLLDKLPAALTEGSRCCVAITRGAIAERGRLKLPLGKLSHDTPSQPDLACMLREEGHCVQTVRRFPVAVWDELIGGAMDRSIAFSGGQLLIDPTPAMTVIDIDGGVDTRLLSMAAVAPIAAMLRRFDMGGVVGIDFPTISSKSIRREVDAALGEALADWPHERTAMNGFGFVQIVARLMRPSLFHRAAHAGKGMLVRQLLRRAEHEEGPGALLLTMHPMLQTFLEPDWIDALVRRTGRIVRIATDDDLALEGAFCQAVSI